MSRDPNVVSNSQEEEDIARGMCCNIVFILYIYFELLKLLHIDITKIFCSHTAFIARNKGSKHFVT